MSEKKEDVLEGIEQKTAENIITPGCIVLEGGAFRGLYTQGVLDALMEHHINLQATVGVSAGALSGLNYVSRQIGRSALVNLSYRHDQNYVGYKVLSSDRGITGFSYLFGDINEAYPFDEEAFNDPARRYVAVCTNVETGRPEYFDRDDTEDIYTAVSASATVPYVSFPVEMNEQKYLDGGVSDNIPFQWAIDEGYEKIVVVRTREKEFRKDVKPLISIIHQEYKEYPMIQKNLLEEAQRYNIQVERLNQLEQQGRVFVIAPSQPVTISRFEGDTKKLRDLYDLGVSDTKNILADLQGYLQK